MSFRFKRRESLKDGFRRILGTELESVQLLLQAAASGSQPEAAIHAARKSLKKLRSFLRLLRKALGKDLCAQHVRALGDVAGKLAPARDARVQLAALDSIVKEVGPPRSALAEELRQSLITELQGAERRALETGSIADLNHIITTTWAAMAAVPLEDDWELVADGVRRMCRRFRKAHAAAKNKGGTTAFHNWRKRAKDMQYQMRLFRGLCPEKMKRLDDRLDRLNELLGEEHDLAILEGSLIEAIRPARLGSATAVRLLKAIAKRRQRLQGMALRQGKKVLDQKPCRITAGWNDWRKSWLNAQCQGQKARMAPPPRKTAPKPSMT